jgi:hypothetical protein
LDFALELVVGVLLVFFALRRQDPRKKRTGDRSLDGAVSPAQAFGFASMLNIVGFPGAVPYFAAADAIMRADLPALEGALAVAYYCAVFLVPLGAIVLLRALLGQHGDAFLAAVSRFLGTWGKRILMTLMFLLGAVMVVDASFYWIGGSPLIPIGWPGQVP